MAYSLFPSVQTAPGKDGSGDKSTQVPPAGKPSTQPDQKPAEVAPAPKS